MAFNSEETGPLVYGHRLSSVGPGQVTGDISYEPTNMDLAMKLHYIRVVYFFDQEAMEGITVPKIKESMFTWLNYYYEACGRLRRSEESGGRPVIKCNDCGVRFIEAKSNKTMKEWLEMEKQDGDGGVLRTEYTHKFLVSNQVLGPELVFSPMVLVQFTFFKCGGAAVGLSWAHILGDVFSLIDFTDTWSKIISGQKPTHSPNINKSQERSDIHTSPKSVISSDHPLSLKKIDSVGNHWIKPLGSTKMSTFTFHFNPAQLSQVQKQVSGPDVSDPFPMFEILCAVFWKAIAKVRSGSEPSTVTIVKSNGAPHRVKEQGKDLITNEHVVTSVEADMPVSEASLKELAKLVHDCGLDQRAKIAQMVGEDNGMSDFILYGANITFLNWEDADSYGFKIKAHKPCLVNFFIDGVGDQGAIIVTPGPGDTKVDGKAKNGNGGRTLTVVVPESELPQLKHELKTGWLIE